MSTKLRLLPTVVAGIGALVLLSAGLIFAVGSLTTRSIVAELASRIVARSMDGLEIALRAHLDAASHQASFVANALRDGDVTFERSDLLTTFISGSLAAAPQIGSITVADATGAGIRVARFADAGLGRERFSTSGDPQLERAVNIARQRKQAYWAPPTYRPRLEATMIMLTVPVWREEAYLGYVAVAISTEALSELAMQLSSPPRSTVFVLYGRDQVLAHMFLALQPPGLSPGKPLLSVREIIDPIISHLEGAPTLSSVGFKPPEGVEAFDVSVTGTHYLAFKKTLLGYGEVPLVIGAYSTAASVDEPLRAMVRATGIGAFLLAAALLCAVYISRKITRPIRDTAEGAAAIASLDFEKVKPLRPSRIKELDDLATSFNTMLTGLSLFARYVPRTLVNRLIRDNRVSAGSEERELTVMFTDIAGFMSMCEGMSPTELAAFVNHHLALVAECIEREGGTIDKYIGDAVMAFWGAPDNIDDAPVRACRAAIAIEQAIAEDNKKREAEGLRPVRIRIGVHTGQIVVGDIGAPSRINYTVVGDVVNAAQRLEQLGKEIAPRARSIILISRNTMQELDKSFTVTKAGRFRVKGRRSALGVYRLEA